MKHALATTWILTGCLTGAFASDPTSVQHPGAQATPSPEVSAQSQTGLANAVVELENDAVVVVRIRIAPHERTPMHDIASARLVVWLTDAHLRDTLMAARRRFAGVREILTGSPCNATPERTSRTSPWNFSPSCRKTREPRRQGSPVSGDR